MRQARVLRSAIVLIKELDSTAFSQNAGEAEVVVFKNSISLKRLVEDCLVFG
jgi:hypothetical protein